jgi:hypothetical protein
LKNWRLGTKVVDRMEKGIGHTHIYWPCGWWSLALKKLVKGQVWKILTFWVDFVAENSNKLQRIGFGMKNQLSPWCVHTWANSTGYTSTLRKKQSDLMTR